MRTATLWAVSVLAVSACAGATLDVEDASRTDVGEPFRPAPPGPVAAEPQRDGDPDAGYQTLVDVGYVTCGIPAVMYDRVQGPAPEPLRLPGRTGSNVTMPYAFTRSISPRGVEIVAPNCLLCHAGQLRGEIVVGLGDHASDYTTDLATTARLGRGLTDDPAALAEFDYWYARASVVGRATILPSGVRRSSPRSGRPPPTTSPRCCSRTAIP